LWWLVPGLAFIALLTVAVLREGGDLEAGDPAPAFSAPALAGGSGTSLTELRGKPVVLNFWASWCVPCVEEAGLFKAAHERYGDRAHFVGINIRDARSDAIDFVAEYGLDYLHVRDEALAIYDDYGLTGQPETFFLDDRGRLVEHVAGPVDQETLFGLLDILAASDA
jgi:cytochrome c biogenesis protein CcmG/thiol:disulfide interchange protein DsbE